MKNKGRIVSLLVSALLLSLIVASIPQTTINQDTSIRGVEQGGSEQVLDEPNKKTTIAFEDHVPIKIAGNQEFNDTADLERWEGNGTENNPYIIEGYRIDRDGDDGHCIQISNTDVHFIIRDCNLTGAYVAGRAGIWLENVVNGLISNNEISNSYNGIYLDAGHIIVENNDIAAVSLLAGIGVLSLNNSLIIGNIIDSGLRGIVLWDTHDCEISNNTIFDQTESGIWLYDSSMNTISDTDCINTNSNGIVVDESNHTTLLRNNCSEAYYGIALADATNTTVSNCTFHSNTQAITLVDSSYNYVEYCKMKDSIERAIWITGTSTNNVFNWNGLWNSGVYHVHLEDPYNSVEYNYYDTYSGPDYNGDGFGDLPRQHFCLSDDVYDYHPIVNEPKYPEWNPAPVDQHLEYGESLSYDLDVTSAIPIVSWQVSDSAFFTVNEEGTISNLEPLDIGTHPLIVTITNAYEMSMDASFSVIVDDTTDPVWISQIINKTYDYGESIEFQLTAWDLAGIDHWTISDSNHFTLIESSYADTSIATIEATSTLASGAYPLTITVYDNNDNSANAQFYVNVGEEATDTTDPIWIVLPYDISIEEGESFYLQVGAWDESGIASWNLTGSSSFAIDENGVITNTETLSVGTYDLEVSAYDPEGNYCSAEFTVTVIEIPSDGTTTTTTTSTTTDTVGVFDTGFIMGTTGLAVAVLALIMGLGAFLNTRKKS